MSLEFRGGGLIVVPASTNAIPLEIRYARAVQVEPQGIDPLTSYTNYLLGNDPARWRRHVANFAKVGYRGLYRGIDAIFYGNGPHIEQDFIVSPGADYGQIRLRFPQDANISIGPGGRLKVALGKSTFAMQSPSVYQDGIHGREPRSGSFRRFAGNEIGFNVERYDRSRPLIIDPILTYETYLSGYALGGQAIATDANGDTFVTGSASYLYPTTPGSFSGCDSCSASTGVVTFVSKLSPDGTKLLYSTVLGGNDPSQPTGLAVDAVGNVLVCGSTMATDFPTKSGQPVLNQYHNQVGFLVSLSPDGSSLNYGTLIGQNPNSASALSTVATAVALDTSGNAYVTGQSATGFSVTSGALDNEVQLGSAYGEYLVYVQKFSPAGTLAYSAIIGTADPVSAGGGPIGTSAIAVASTGEAYVTGQAGSLWKTTSNAYHTQLPAGDTYATPFVAKVSADGTALLYSTYLDYVYQMSGIAVLANGNVFVAGVNASTIYPTTPGAFEPMTAGGNNSILTELDATGSTLVYSTALIGPLMDGMTVAPDGDIWLVGSENLLMFPDVQLPLQNPLQTSIANSFIFGALDVPMVAQFDSKGQTLKFSTYLGGATVGSAVAIAMDANNHAHITGVAAHGLYTSSGALLSTLPVSVQDNDQFAFLAQIDPSGSEPSLCADPDDLNFSGTGGGLPAGVPADQTVTLSNCGAGPLTISQITSTSALYSVHDNMCTSALQVGNNCTITVRYTPVTTSTDTATIWINYNTSMPAFVSVWGEGQALTGVNTTILPSALSFGDQVVGSQSGTQNVTLTNIGTLPVSFSSATITGPQMGSFAVTTTCPSTLNPGQSCNLSVVFSPTSAGSATATLDIVDSAGAETVSLTGLAVTTPFSINPQPGGSLNATVSSGLTASYLLSLVPAEGYSGAVSLSCTGLPAHAVCSFNPANVALAGGLPANFALSVTTSTSNGTSAKVGLLFGFTLLFVTFRLRKRRAFSVFLVILMVANVYLTACGGGGSGSTITLPPSNAVSPGTYTFQVVATDGKSTLTQNLTLVVQ